MAAISRSMWRGARGYFYTSGPTGEVEVDTFTCQHCNRVVFCCDRVTKKPLRAEDCGGICNNCKGNICPRCVNLGVCIPLERALQRMETRREYENL